MYSHMEEHTVLRIRTPPPDEVMEERHARRKQSHSMGCFTRFEQAVTILCLVSSISIVVYSIVLLWTGIYSESR